MRILLFSVAFSLSLLLRGTLAQEAESDTLPRVIFYQLYALNAYEGFSESAIPSVEDDPSIILVPERLERADDVAEWLKRHYRYDDVEVIEVQTVVEVHYRDRHEITPMYFNAGFSSEYRIWCFGAASSPLSDFISTSLAVDLNQLEFLPQLQITLPEDDLLLIGKRCSYADEGTTLESFDDFTLRNDIFFIAVIPYQIEVSSSEEYRPAVEQYMRLRGQQKARAGTILLLEDQGYQVIEELFRRCFAMEGFDFAKNKRLPISTTSNKVIASEYDIPPRLVRGTEVIKRALNRVLKADERARLQNLKVNVLIDEKGQIEEMNVEGSVDEILKHNLLRALRLMKWEPAMYEGRPVKVWTVLAIPEI